MTELQVKLNDNTTFYVDVDDYDADQIAEQLNDNSKQMVVIGNAVIQRYSILRVIPKSEVDSDE